MVIIILIILLSIYLLLTYKRQHLYTPNELFTHLGYISGILSKYNIKYWLSYGTLLGAIRQHDIIPYDYDFDLGANIDDVDKILDLNHIVGYDGYEFKKLYMGDIWRVSLKVFYKGVEMGDIYLYKKFDDGFMRRFDIISGTYFWPKSTFPYWFIEQLETTNIRDTIFPIPKDSEKLLEHWYGSTWKTPIKAKAQGGQGDGNSDYYGGANNMKLNFLTNYVKSKNIFLQPLINKKINVIYPKDQIDWIKENEMII